MSAKIYFCYAHEDEPLLNELKYHLEALRRQGLIDIWYDRNISAGVEWAKEIDKHLDTAKIILLLVSQYFMASDYCYGIEMKRAMERHGRGEAIVIPIILRPVYWQGAPFGKLQALPTDAKPVKSKSWIDQDEALFDVAEGIRKLAEQMKEYVLYRSLMGHSGKIWDVAISHDGYIISGSEDQTVNVWNLRTGQLLNTLTGHSKIVWDVAISREGYIISGSGDQTIKVWNLRTGQLLRTLTGHLGNVAVVAISPDGQTIVSGSEDQTIKVWNLHTGQLLHTLTGHSGEVMGIAMGPEGQTIVSGGSDKTIKVWLKS